MTFSRVLQSLGVCALLGAVTCTAIGAPPDNVCELLSRAEVAAVLGSDAGEGRRSGNTLCEWSVPASPRAKKIKVSRQDSQAFDGAKEDVGHGIVKTRIVGLGDDAVYVLTPKFAVSLAFRKNGDVFFVDINGFALDSETDVQKVEAHEKALAVHILQRL